MSKEILQDIRSALEYQQALGLTEIPLDMIAQRKTTKAPAKKGGAQSGNGNALASLRAEIGDCTRCRLHKGRTNLVFGVGNPNAEIMFVGEAPGRDEDLKGEPFVGRAGQLLTKIIGAMGYKRSDVYIANINKCLRYNAMVQLGSGKWERIGRLVRNQYEGTVKSIDGEGNIVNKKVVGWHATALGDRDVYKLTFKSAKMAGSNQCAINATGDHPVLTERGYVPIQDLDKNDRIATGQGLSRTLKHLIWGMLLGDGHINSKQSYLACSHSEKQAAYAKFKFSLLQKEFDCVLQRKRVGAGNNKKYSAIIGRTRASRALRIIHDEFYTPKKGVPKHLSETLNPLTLAVWFMDDGYMRIRSPRQPSAEIATCSFSQTDLRTLIKGLKKLGISAYSRRDRIFFDVRATKKLSKVIAPYVHPSMRHKLHPDIEPKIPFNKALYEDDGKQEVLYDHVKSGRIRFNGTDKTFYCIDVEDTNNFVTTGGVVHNCRPPNNRAPARDEADACLPFLHAQVSVIRPKVIVCLGSVAVQNLLNTDEKISHLRGRWQEFDGIPVMPTYHPAFLLRNPNMKKPVWEDMQEVMKMLG